MSKSRQYTVVDGDEKRNWEVESVEDGRYRVTTPDGEVLEVDAFEPADDQLHLLVEGTSVDAAFVDGDVDFEVNVGGERHDFQVLNDRQRRMRKAGAGPMAGGAPELVSPMAGGVVEVVAEIGQAVQPGDRMVVVEAMKMENALEAHRAGVVESIGVEVGDSVEIDDVLVTIADAET